MDTLSPSFGSTTNDSSDIDGLRIDPKTMFADHKGIHKPRIEKKQRKLARKLAFLKGHLEDDEHVLVVTTAVSPTRFLEQMTTGFIFVYIKRCLLVFTNKRILHIPTTSGYNYRNSLAQIRYADIDTIKQPWGRLKVRYRTGEKELFLYIRSSERKKIRALLPDLDRSGTPSKIGRRVHLCPRCTSELEVDVFQCPNCKLEFKSRRTARMLSILLPGGGYFYTGHWILGISDAFIEVIFLLVILTVLFGGSGPPAYDGAIIFGLLLFIEKAITVYHANHFVKEYLTKDRVIRPATAFAE